MPLFHTAAEELAANINLDMSAGESGGDFTSNGRKREKNERERELPTAVFNVNKVVSAIFQTTKTARKLPPNDPWPTVAVINLPHGCSATARPRLEPLVNNFKIIRIQICTLKKLGVT